MTVVRNDTSWLTHTAYVLVCPTHGDLGSAVGAFAAGRVLRQHPCLDAYAEPRRRERRRGGLTR
jgi:hypothetical protein